ncbi:MAG: hypothetical protein Q8L85_08460 [Alphaproteobacteria bacterium]|nr:hypothetical protein [Alphaproteobacteria bacterium]
MKKSYLFFLLLSLSIAQISNTHAGGKSASKKMTTKEFNKMVYNEAANKFFNADDLPNAPSVDEGIELVKQKIMPQYQAQIDNGEIIIVQPVAKIMTSEQYDEAVRACAAYNNRMGCDFAISFDGGSTDIYQGISNDEAFTMAQKEYAQKITDGEIVIID